MKPKVSCVLCTFGRHATVQRSIGMWMGQDYPLKELLIFNTAPEPLLLGDELKAMANVRVINAPNREDGSPWTSLGQVRNAALGFCSGFLYACWDDDDLFLPWHLSQSVERWAEQGRLAWKPKHSLWSTDGGKSFSLAGNSMEASILVEFHFVLKHGFSENQSGAEHVQGGWLDKARQENELAIEDVRPSYGYIWGDGLHKTSGAIDNPDNFTHHQNASQDFGNGQPLIPATQESLQERFRAAYDF